MENQALNPDLSDSKDLCPFPYTGLFLSVTREWWFLEREERAQSQVTPRQ